MRRQYRHTALAAVLAAIWLGTPILSAAHAALDEHTYCAEHGTLEEGVTHHGAAETPAAADSRAFRASTSGPDGEPHAACAFGEFTVNDIVPFDVTVTLEKLPITAHVDALPERRVAHAFCILLAAPKTSPPRIA